MTTGRPSTGGRKAAVRRQTQKRQAECQDEWVKRDPLQFRPGALPKFDSTDPAHVKWLAEAVTKEDVNDAVGSPFHVPLRPGALKELVTEFGMEVLASFQTSGVDLVV